MGSLILLAIGMVLGMLGAAYFHVRSRSEGVRDPYKFDFRYRKCPITLRSAASSWTPAATTTSSGHPDNETASDRSIKAWNESTNGDSAA